MDQGNIDQQSRAYHFIEAVKNLCRYHKCWISHEDGHGGFEVVVDPKPKDAEMLSHWFGGADVDLMMSTGCDHTWVASPNRPFDTCTSCKASRRTIEGEDLLESLLPPREVI